MLYVSAATAALMPRFSQPLFRQLARQIVSSVPGFRDAFGVTANMGFIPHISHADRAAWEAYMGTAAGGAPCPITEYANATLGLAGGLVNASSRSVYAPLTLFMLNDRNAATCFDYYSLPSVRGGRAGTTEYSRLTPLPITLECVLTPRLAAQRDGNSGAAERDGGLQHADVVDWRRRTKLLRHRSCDASAGLRLPHQLQP